METVYKVMKRRGGILGSILTYSYGKRGPYQEYKEGEVSKPMIGLITAFDTPLSAVDWMAANWLTEEHIFFLESSPYELWECEAGVVGKASDYDLVDPIHLYNHRRSEVLKRLENRWERSSDLHLTMSAPGGSVFCEWVKPVKRLTDARLLRRE